ncbi:glucan phosphoethanolaminetransferase (alkaline phosphatase superfamily) [Kutzneria viridogrisea]|uniref:Uncharacterized protein n=2 Tax=Kutzneria TaxID=43356 RepID=W5W9N3_9PSEU|nr:hypothetical protein [Kutzneria albida]AHH97475.1 hypothetical protein KALB_4111 [Kutzneria albida DSM 43870]MBA8930598.1 glucan phosphoethanolaminetransferase (alkaline phosphatase superfamily) [Kutzneria viridogrisea]
MGRGVGKRTRQLLVFVHVAVSVGWMGAGAANVVLAMTAGYTASAEVRQVCYQMIDQVDGFVVIPIAFAALASGVLLCLVTPWGLARYWWVLVKLVLTVAVIGYSTFGLGTWVEDSIAASTRGVESPVAGQLAYGAGLNIAAFLFMTWLSVAKPWGKTPWAPASPRRGHRPVAPRLAAG